MNDKPSKDIQNQRGLDEEEFEGSETADGCNKGVSVCSSCGVTHRSAGLWERAGLLLLNWLAGLHPTAGRAAYIVVLMIIAAVIGPKSFDEVLTKLSHVLTCTEVTDAAI